MRVFKKLDIYSGNTIEKFRKRASVFRDAQL